MTNQRTPAGTTYGVYDPDEIVTIIIEKESYGEKTTTKLRLVNPKVDYGAECGDILAGFSVEGEAHRVK